jgi:hypothetical protein
MHETQCLQVVAGEPICKRDTAGPRNVNVSRGSEPAVSGLHPHTVGRECGVVVGPLCTDCVRNGSGSTTLAPSALWRLAVVLHWLEDSPWQTEAVELWAASAVR